MKKLLTMLAVTLVIGAIALTAAYARTERGPTIYICDGCDARASRVFLNMKIDGWVKVEVATVRSNHGYALTKDLDFCPFCRDNPEQQRKLGANLMKNGVWVKPDE